MDKIEAIKLFSSWIQNDISPYKTKDFKVLKVMGKNDPSEQIDKLSTVKTGVPGIYGGFELCYLKNAKKFFLKYYAREIKRPITYKLLFSDLQPISKGIIYFLKYSAQRGQSMHVEEGRLSVADQFEL